MPIYSDDPEEEYRVEQMFDKMKNKEEKPEKEQFELDPEKEEAISEYVCLFLRSVDSPTEKK